MTSYLIISTQPDILFKKTLELCEEKKISTFDTTWFDLVTADSKTSTKKSWGIEDIKQMQKKIFLKPMHGSWKAIVVKDAHLLTPEAQSAMLKILEEPPNGTLFILTASSDQSFLPTILSRCSILRLEATRKIMESDQIRILSEIDVLAKEGIGNRLKKAEELSKNKDEAVSWIATALVAIHSTMRDENSVYSLRRLKLLHEFYKSAKNTNANLRLSLEAMFLSLT